ncbi:MAG: glutathione S-transferase family protein [Desulfuromonadales bacterium]|jgi:glutathione S-transferase
MPDIELFSARVCPFAHRSRLALAEKGLPHRIVEINLRNKPDWFGEISPLGKVPALRQGDFRLCESLVINEYVNDRDTQQPLLPQDPRQRARARLWIALFDDQVVPGFYRLLKANQADKRHQAETSLAAGLKRLEEGLQENPGPYWCGDTVSLTDMAIYPWFERWPVLEHYRNYPLAAQYARLHDWITAMQERDAVVSHREDAGFYLDEYADYAAGTR